MTLNYSTYSQGTYLILSSLLPLYLFIDLRVAKVKRKNCTLISTNDNFSYEYLFVLDLWMTEKLFYSSLKWFTDLYNSHLWKPDGLLDENNRPGTFFWYYDNGTPSSPIFRCNSKEPNNWQVPMSWLVFSLIQYNLYGRYHFWKLFYENI